MDIWIYDIFACSHWIEWRSYDTQRKRQNTWNICQQSIKKERPVETFEGKTCAYILTRRPSTVVLARHIWDVVWWNVRRQSLQFLLVMNQILEGGFHACYFTPLLYRYLLLSYKSQCTCRLRLRGSHILVRLRRPLQPSQLSGRRSQ